MLTAPSTRGTVNPRFRLFYVSKRSTVAMRQKRHVLSLSKQKIGPRLSIKKDPIIPRDLRFFRLCFRCFSYFISSFIFSTQFSSLNLAQHNRQIFHSHWMITEPQTVSGIEIVFNKSINEPADCRIGVKFPYLLYFLPWWDVIHNTYGTKKYLKLRDVRKGQWMFLAYIRDILR